MNNDKKPGEPLETERRAEMENEIRKLKQSTSLLGIGMLLQDALIFGIILSIHRIYDMLATIGNILGSITDFHRSILQILEIFKNLLF